MKHTKIKTNHGLTIIIVFIFLFGIVIYLVTNANKTYAPQTNMATNGGKTENFQSKDLRFSIQTPQNFQIKASNTGVDIIHADTSIEIVRNGTSFPTLSEYITDFDSKRNIKTKEMANVNINGYESIKRYEERIVGGVVKNSKVYYIWIDYAVYILSTDSEDLFPALDQIAQSFHYAP